MSPLEYNLGMDAAGIILMVFGIVVTLLVGLGIVFGLAMLLLRGVARRSRNTAHQHYPGARLVDAGALFFGQESRGVGQLRGNGTLIVTDAEVIFQQWMTSREFRIPLTAIQAIENPTSFLGKWQGVPLLKISFLDDSGTADSMAWRVRDLSAVQRAIDEARTSSASQKMS